MSKKILVFFAALNLLAATGAWATAPVGPLTTYSCDLNHDNLNAAGATGGANQPPPPVTTPVVIPANN